MLTLIYCVNHNYLIIDKILYKEGDVEVEDIEEDEEDIEEEEGYKEKTPDLTEEIFRDNGESLSISECF